MSGPTRVSGRGKNSAIHPSGATALYLSAPDLVGEDFAAKRALGIAGMSAARSKTTFLSARFRRLRGRHGYSEALVPTEHSTVTAIWHILTNGEFYHDYAEDFVKPRSLCLALS